MEKILSFKHWQLFLIFMCIFWVSPSPLKEIINFIGILTFIIWIYSIGKYGQIKIEELNLPKLDDKLFKLNLVVITLFLIIKYFFLTKEINETGILNLIHIALTIYLIFAFIQIIVFASKTLSTLELRKETKFSDYSSDFFMFIFFFIGLWMLQPKVNKLFSKE